MSQSNKESVARDILSDIVVHMKYARYLPEKQRRETWEEIVTRNMAMHIRKFPFLEDEIRDAYRFVYEKKVLPSMRSMQFGGRAIEVGPQRIYNCAYTPVDDVAVFGETMFLLLSGVGVGYSVQYHHVDKLPLLKGPVRPEDRRHRPKRYLIEDSIEGWADAIKVLMKSYFYGTKEIEFDFRAIRPKGALLVTSGGKAPGPQPLKDCIHEIRGILDRALEERGVNAKLRPVEVHDVMCHIADAVLAGGIRRSAMISLFSFDDEEMRTCKFGNWWESNPQRGRSNNSAVALRHRATETDFWELWKRVEASGSGEPGIFFTNDRDWGSNPCCEVSLRPNQFCNLVELNVSNLIDQSDYNARAKAASLIATLQSSFTDLHYLRDIWRETTEKDSLIGVSMTGIASGRVLELNMREAAGVVNAENERVAELIGVSPAARTTTVKPSGTSSLVLGTSSGIHAWHNDYYIRNMRVGKDEAIYTYLSVMHPELIEDEFFRPDKQAVISVPIRAPEGAITRHENPIALLERSKRVYDEWIKPGHRSGANSNNVSITVSVKEDEWEQVGHWMWENRDSYNGIAVLPHDGGNYVQAPFQDATKDEYEEMLSKLVSVDLTKVIEDEDGTNLMGEVACSGGACEVTTL